MCPRLRPTGDQLDQGCLVPHMYNTGEPSHEEAIEHHPSAQTQLYHDVDSYMDIPWPRVTWPSPAWRRVA